MDDKAKDLLENSRLYTKVIAGRLRRDYPNAFRDVNSIERFEFFSTIAQVFLTCIRLYFEVGEELRTPLEITVKGCIDDWYFEGMNAYDDVKQFVTKNIIKEPDRGKRSLLLYELVASWTIKRTMHDSTEPPIELNDILASLSTYFIDGSVGYWKSEV